MALRAGVRGQRFDGEVPSVEKEAIEDVVAEPVFVKIWNGFAFEARSSGKIGIQHDLAGPQLTPAVRAESFTQVRSVLP